MRPNVIALGNLWLGKFLTGGHPDVVLNTASAAGTCVYWHRVLCGAQKGDLLVVYLRQFHH
jgi:hypothetical protein